MMLLAKPYMQLHRDTTVMQLTMSPSLSKGRVVWQDSPLVRAMKYGRVLVVDEADKAPREVMCILKGLAERGIRDGQEESMIALPDGRVFISGSSVFHNHRRRPHVHYIHPEFRLVALANRPGFPFLGNDFFSEAGDVFAAHVIDNPDVRSEVRLLQSYAPGIDEGRLVALAESFADLRQLFDRGQLSYPYSTREAVAVVKHMQQNPQAGWGSGCTETIAMPSKAAFFNASHSGSISTGSASSSSSQMEVSFP